jgi:thiamine-phosphate pyrophosphorylase
LSSSGEATARTFPSRRPLYYYITDRRALAGTTLLACVRRQISRGVDIVQIREKDLPDRAVLSLASRIGHAASGTTTRVLLNGRADLAVVAGLDGVHLPSTGPDPDDIRGWTAPGFLIGVSVHSTAEALRAAASGADYLLLGHVFPTPSKADHGSPVGLETLREVCGAVAIPVFALGGVRPEHIVDVVDSGAVGVAGIRLFQELIDFPFSTGQNRITYS